MNHELKLQHDGNDRITDRQGRHVATVQVYAGDEWVPRQVQALRLLTAAPDLFSACEAAQAELELISSDQGFDPSRFRERLDVLSQLNAAICKAQGKL